MSWWPWSRKPCKHLNARESRWVDGGVKAMQALRCKDCGALVFSEHPEANLADWRLETEIINGKRLNVLI